MNCRPNDTAIIIRSAPVQATFVGKICTVLRLFGVVQLPNGRKFMTWLIELDRPMPFSKVIDDSGNTALLARESRHCVWPDAWLRPLRDHGDDAVDETLIYAGKPDTLRDPRAWIEARRPRRLVWPQVERRHE